MCFHEVPLWTSSARTHALIFADPQEGMLKTILEPTTTLIGPN